MKLLLLIIVSICLFSCGKDDPGPAKRLERREEVYNDSSSQMMTFEYDSKGRIVTVKVAFNNQPLQVYLTVSYNANEAMAVFQPYIDGSFTTTRQVRLLLDAEGNLLKRYFHAQRTDASDLSFYETADDTMDLSYDAAGFLTTISYHRFDTTWRPGSSWTSRDSFITQYSTVDGKLTNADQLGGTTNTLYNGSNTVTSRRTKEYHSIFSYSKLHPNNFDCSNAAILNLVIGFNASSQYYDVNVYEPIVSSTYRYMPDRTQKHALEKEENGNIAVGFNSDVEMDRTYNKDGMLATTEVLTPAQGMKRIRYFYRR